MLRRQPGVLAVMLALPALVVLLAACGERPGAASDGETTSLALRDGEEALRQDARTYAKDYGVSTGEAVRRLRLQDDVGRLGAGLRANERETFADLELRHEPEYRVIAYFTRGGGQKIRPYVAGTPLEGMVEVRQVGLTLPELEAVQEEAMRIADDLDIPVASDINITKNRAELYVPDRTSFAAALREADEELPGHVAVIGPENPPLPPKEADKDVFFSRQEFGSGGGMEALTGGKLILDSEGCLRLIEPGTGYDIVPVWPADFGPDTEGDEIRVLDRRSRIVGRVGEKVELGGGDIPKKTLEENDLVDKQALRELFGRCPGAYWLVTAE